LSGLLDLLKMLLLFGRLAVWSIRLASSPASASPVGGGLDALAHHAPSASPLSRCGTPRLRDQPAA
jgi:hypothetical protein